MKALDKHILMVLFVLILKSLLIIFLQTKPKGVTIHITYLGEHILMALIVLIQKRVHFIANET